MKQKPRWTLEMLIAALAVLCALLTLALLVQRPAGWPALAVLVVLWGIGICVFRYQLRRWTAKWVAGGSFENSRTQYSLESLSQPAALLSGETVLWYNSRFRTALLGGEDRLAGRAQKLLPGLDTAQARTPEGQQLNLADGVWNVHSSTVPGGSESMTLLVFNEETALRRIETEYKASRPGYMVFLVDGYDDVFSDMLDSERARLLEGINRVLEDMIGRGTGFLRRVASEIFIPLTVGGSINTLDDFDRVLKCGADKVSVNSGAIKNPELIKEAAQKYGNQCVVLSADIKRVDGQFMLFAKGGRENTGIDALSWLEQGVKNGAGELVVNSIDTDGVKNGFDLELLDAVAARCAVPIIASGGAGKKEDFLELFHHKGIDAGLAAGIFHQKLLGIRELKEYLNASGVEMRL